MKDTLILEERSTFQKKINDILKKNPIEDLIQDLVKLHYLRLASKNEDQAVIVEVYNLLGAEKFAELIETINGKTITFPTRESFKESVQIALCYYFKYMKGKKWTEIKELLQDEEVSSIKFGINCNKLNTFINEMATHINFKSKHES